MHAPVLNVLNKSINQYVYIYHEYPMTVLLKIVNNSMTALLNSFECSIMLIELLKKRSGHGLTG